MQQPSYQKPLTLAIILVVLSSLVYWFEFSKKPANEAAEFREKKVFGMDDPSVRKIALYRSDRQIVLECTNPKDQCRQKANTQWVVQEPLKTKADSSHAQSLLATLIGMGGPDVVSLKDETPETRQSLLKSYKLDAESRKAATTPRIQVTDDSGRTVTAYIGEMAETSNSHYVLSESDGKANEDLIFVVPKHQATAFEQPLNHWRDKRIVSFNQNEISSFELTTSAGKVVATKAPGTWNLGEGDARQTADLDTMDTFLSGVVFLNAKNFVAEKKDSPEGKKAMSGLKLEATLVLKAAEKSQTLRLFSKTFRDGKNTASIAFATVDELDPVFEVETSSLDRVKKKVADFRLKKLLPVNDRGEVRFARFTIPSGKSPQVISVKLEGSEWKRVGEGKAVAGANVNALLDEISGPVIENFLPDQAAPATAIQIELGSSEQEIRHRFQVWKAGRKIIARNPDATSKELYSLSDSASDAIPFTEGGLTAPRAAPPALPEPTDPHGGDHDGHAH